MSKLDGDWSAHEHRFGTPKRGIAISTSGAQCVCVCVTAGSDSPSRRPGFF